MTASELFELLDKIQDDLYALKIEGLKESESKQLAQYLEKPISFLDVLQ